MRISILEVHGLRRETKGMNIGAEWLSELTPGKGEQFAFMSVDIVEHSRISAKWAWADTSPVFNAFEKYVERRVRKRKGMIWVWLGDGGLCAFWGEDVSKKAQNAYDAASAILRGLSRFNREHELPGDEKVRVRIALHVGNAEYRGLEELGRVHSSAINFVSHLEKQATAPNSISMSDALFSELEESPRERIYEIEDLFENQKIHTTCRKWTEEMKISRDECLSTLQKYYGPHTKADDSFLNYVVSNILDKTSTESSIWREDVSSVITIKKATKPVSLVKRGLFAWQETKKYWLVCPAKTGEQPIISGSTLIVEWDAIQDILDAYEMWIKVDGEKIFDSKIVTRNIDLRRLRSRKRIVKDGMSVSYKGLRLDIEVERSIEMDGKSRKHVTIFEKIFLEPNDRSYILSSRWPTRIFKANVSLQAGLDDWEIVDATVGPQRYHRDASELATVEIGDDRDWVDVNVHDWVLPGIGVVIEWKPKTEEG